MNPRYRLLLLLLPLLISGCGYSFKGLVNSLPADIKQVKVAPIYDHTNSPVLAGELQTSLEDEWIRRPGIRRCKSAEIADATIECDLIKVVSKPSRYNSLGQVSSNQLEIITNLKLIDNKNGRLLNQFTERHFSINLIVKEDIEPDDREWQQKAARKLAQNMIVSILEEL